MIARPGELMPAREVATSPAQPTSRTRQWLRRGALALVGLIVLLLAFVGALTLTRGTPVDGVLALGDRSGAPGVADPLFLRTLQLHAGAHLSAGAGVTLLLNGDGTYPVLWKDLRRARQTITVQLYYSQPGAVADTLAHILAERARAGVKVLALFDGFGSANLTGGWRDSLRAAGVELAFLRPVRWYNVDKLNSRSHVRAIVVDGAIGYSGGFGLADYWLGDGHRENQWRETNVRVEGPIVAELQAAFAAAWAEATGQLLTGDLFFPPVIAEVSGPQRASILHTAPTMGSTPAERLLALSISGARRTLYVTNSYFLPDDDFREMLIGRARAGVDVRILTASTKTDIKSVYYAGRDRYQSLLDGGVRIYEYQPTMVHAKSFVVDGLWSAVGSMNFDNRSLSFNDEINLLTHDASIGARMDSVFRDDLRYSREIVSDTFRRRPWHERVLERGASLLSRVL